MAEQHMEAFRISPFAIGLDLTRSQVKTALGNYVVDEDTPTVIRAGMVVQQDATTQKIEVCAGVTPFGFAKFNRSDDLYSMVVGEYIQLNGTSAISLAHNNLFNPGTNLGVRVGSAMTGTPYTHTTDFTVQHAAGTITRVGGGTIPDGGYVYVNYQHKMSTSDLALEGLNFWNTIDDAQYQDGKFTVITDWATLFTAQYNPAVTYTVGMELYAGHATDSMDGYVDDTNGTGTAYIGRVFQVPTAIDPFLGIRYVGGMVS
jgi:hypothetical protein